MKSQKNYQGLMEDHRVKEAFLKLHAKWLSANHRSDMNSEMDELALVLGLNPNNPAIAAVESEGQ